MNQDPSLTLRLVASIASIGVVISTLELLVAGREFGRGGLYDWDIVRQGFPPSRITRCLDRAFSYPAVLWGLTLRLGAALLILTGVADGWTRAVLFILVAVTSFALAWRMPYGLEGAEQMIRIIFSALALSSLVSDRAVAQTAALWFLAVQACLAYITAGLAKYKVPAWRDGSFLRDMLGTRSYGNRRILALTHRLGCVRICSLFIIAFECAFPLVMVVGRPWALAFLVSGVVFHGFNAAVLGLNLFFWAFVATYPAIWYCTR